MIETQTAYTSFSQLSSKQLQQILASKTSSFFQTPRAIRFFKKMGIDTFFYGIGVDEQIMALVSGIIQKEKGLKSTFTKRAIIYGGPVLSKDATAEHVAELFKMVKNGLKNNAIYIETRNLHDYSQFASTIEKTGFTYHSHLNFHVACTTEELTKGRLSKSKVRQINKSRREGAEAREAKTLQEVKMFYKILKNLYKTKVKTPLPTFDFFATLWKDDLAKFFLVFFDDKVVGGIVCPYLDKRVIYEWYVCGEDREYKNIYPSVLATWTAIEYACQHNIEMFDFMGAGKPDDDYGVREFKSKFGGELIEHGRFVYVANPVLYNLGKRAVKTLKRI